MQFDCTICFERITPPSSTLPCTHSFCTGCVLPWIAQAGSCPNCRRDTTEAEVQPNPELDTQIKNLLHRCPYRQCGKRLSQRDLDAHLLVCSWHPTRRQAHIRKCISSLTQIANNCDDEMVLAETAQSLLELGGFGPLRTLFERVPSNEFVALYYMRSLNEQGCYSDTIELFSKYNFNCHYALALVGQGHYSQAIDFLTALSQSSERDTVLALAYKKQGKYSLALPLLQASSHRKDNELRVLLRHTLGDVYRKQGMFELAEAEYDFVLQHAYEGSLLQAEIFHSLGKMNQAQGKWEDATVNYKEALAHIDPSHPCRGIFLVSLADVEREKCYLALSLHHYHEGIELIQERLGQDHIELVDAYRGMAAVYKKYQEYDNSFSWLEEARKLAVATLGDTHYKTALIRKALGDLCRKQNMLDEAWDNLNLAEPLLTGIDKADTLHDIGRVCLARQEFNQCQVWVKQALRQLSDKDVFHRGMFHATQGLCAGMRGEYQTASKKFAKAQDELKTTVGRVHSEMADLYMSRVEVAMKIMQDGRKDIKVKHVKALCKEAKTIFYCVYGSTHPKLALLETYQCICDLFQ